MSRERAVVTPLDALVAAREAAYARAELNARLDAAHRLCASLGHRGSDSACFRCARCVAAVNDCATSLFGHAGLSTQGDHK